MRLCTAAHCRPVCAAPSRRAPRLVEPSWCCRWRAPVDQWLAARHASLSCRVSLAAARRLVPARARARHCMGRSMCRTLFRTTSACGLPRRAASRQREQWRRAAPASVACGAPQCRALAQRRAAHPSNTGCGPPQCTAAVLASCRTPGVCVCARVCARTHTCVVLLCWPSRAQASHRRRPLPAN